MRNKDKSLEREQHSHEDIQQLLPWYATKTLPAGETAMIDEHLKTCPVCISELSKCQSLADNPPQAQQMWQPSASHFAGIMQRIEEADSKASVISANHQLKKRGGLLHRIIEAFSSVPRGLQWTMAFETVACFGLLLALAISVNNPAVFSSRFETLSDQEKPLDTGGNALRVVFADDLTTLELASLLKQVNGQIRQGPSAVGAYVVEVSATAPEKAMEILRADPKVRLVQPITGDSAE